MISIFNPFILKVPLLRHPPMKKRSQCIRRENRNLNPNMIPPCYLRESPKTRLLVAIRRGPLGVIRGVHEEETAVLFGVRRRRGYFIAVFRIR